MLDNETKRRIDEARDILVGKVPDPKSQVEQITIALIYKFMDDMDMEAEELGGERKFFTKSFEQYRWSQLMASELGGHDVLALYAEAITRMPENSGIPELFRDIFKNAYLPYRDPETLKSFLKIIDEFEYDHSERLGDAFEYLLSVLGSQGDAGQFRTPRHIIDFMVEILDPKKDETILDPACGTAGFLISAYKHILKQHTVDGKMGAGLTPEDRTKLVGNFTGYDISPDMVRLSLVNLYLHGFPNPHVEEYDTLTSEAKWNEYADIILANPPFMSPKGGIRPHRRFSVQSKRSEVLFVDYMAEHLSHNGRAAIIVPEGIIFQSQTAYKELRKMLVENSLIAVISLPAGCFNPYSGVKTSILILDKSLSKLSSNIAFFKVENDGFDLGAQRSANGISDLPAVKSELINFMQGIGLKIPSETNSIKKGELVSKEAILSSSDLGLTSAQYRVRAERIAVWPMLKLGDLVTAKSGNSKIIKGSLPAVNDGSLYPAYSASGQDVFSPDFGYSGDGIVISAVGARCGKCFLASGRWQAIANTHVLIPDSSKVLAKYLFLFLNDENFWVKGGAAQPFIKVSASLEISLPIPPLEVQEEIVTEIEGYQKVIDGAKAVVENYNPYIPILDEWPTVKLGDLCEFKNGLNFSKKSSGHAVKIIGVGDFKNHLFASLDNLKEISTDSVLGEDYLIKSEDILFVRSNGNPMLVGRSIILPEPVEPTTFSGFTIRARVVSNKVIPLFLALLFKSRDFSNMIKTVGRGANIRNLSQGILKDLDIQIPPIDDQKTIIKEIEIEQSLVSGNRSIMSRMENKIQSTLGKVWSE